MLAGDWFQASVGFAVIFLSAAAFLIYFGARLLKRSRVAFGLILIVVSLPCLLFGGICGAAAVSEFEALERRRTRGNPTLPR